MAILAFCTDSICTVVTFGNFKIIAFVSMVPMIFGKFAYCTGHIGDYRANPRTVRDFHNRKTIGTLCKIMKQICPPANFDAGV